MAGKVITGRYDAPCFQHFCILHDIDPVRDHIKVDFMKKPVSILVVLILAIAASCTKKPTPVVPNPTATPGDYVSMNEVFGLLTLPTKTVTINADSGGTFYGTSGTRYIFPKSAFVTSAGVTVTGSIQITVNEILKKGDMIFNLNLPVSNGDPLISGGEIYTSAAQGGKQIFLKPYFLYQVNIPQTGKFDNISTYYSGSTLGGSLTNTMNWTRNPARIAGTVFYTKDSVSISSDSLEWCNAARTISSPDYQSFTVTVVATNATISPTDALYSYVMYDNHKGVWALSNASNNVYNEKHTAHMPVHFVSMALINGHFFAGVLPALPTNNTNYTVTLTEVDPVAFKGQINALYP